MFLRDFEAGTLLKKYKADKPYEFKKCRIPRWDLVDTSKIMSLNVQVSRGCPYKCDFCIVPEMYGHKMRYRDIDNVIEEIKSLPLKKIFFADDNLTFNKKYARELTRRLKPLNILWTCQSTIEIAQDDELLKSMADSGCISILIGFESLNVSSLNETNKGHNTKESYEQVIAKIHSFGIHVFGSFMIGFDADTKADLDDIYNFILDNAIPFSAISIVSAAPGTKLYQRMEEQGRLLDIPPRFITGILPTFQHNHFSLIELLDVYFETIEKLYSFENLYTMGMALFGTGKFTNMSGSEVSFFEKLKTTLIMLKSYLATSNPSKRRLFLELFKMHRERRVGINEIVIFLLSMEGFSRYFETMQNDLPALREYLKEIDKGPYFTQKRAPLCGSGDHPTLVPLHELPIETPLLQSAKSAASECASA
jgi:hypothetical protein